MNAPSPREEFYVGWLPLPPHLRRFVRRAVLGIGALAVGVGATLVLGMRRPPAARFEYGAPRAWSGRVALRPAPLLWTAEGEGVLLVAAGKRGAAGLLAPYDGATVTLDAALIERAGRRGAERMLEVVHGSVRAAAGTAPAPPAPRPLGTVRWRGEIVDGKCYLGVMVPGEGKTHRGCAARCLAGGTPPLFALADGRGGAATVLLASADGTPLDGARLAPYVAEPVWISGRLEALGNLLVLRLAPDGIARVVD